MEKVKDKQKVKQVRRAHPWHGVSWGAEAPLKVNCYVEMVPTDTVKYELDKESGLLKVDRPQQYSNICPSMYGLVPQTYCAEKVGKNCAQKCGFREIQGDRDPLDICVLSEKSIARGDLLVEAIPIGGFRLIDGTEADDKILAVLAGDFVHGHLRDISECPEHLIDSLWHYFVTYKDHPGKASPRKIDIREVYGQAEALEVIQLAHQDYIEHFGLD